MIIRQLFDAETFTYTYLVADEETRQAALIDPVLEQIDRDLGLIGELGLTLSHVLETHVHADHVTAAGVLHVVQSRSPAPALPYAATLGVLGLDESFSSLDVSRVLFLDTETTGLSGGAGTLPFLVGLAFSRGAKE